jgi:hypothetical protein
MRKDALTVLTVCVLVVLAGAWSALAQSAQPSDTYAWHGELVSIDDATRSVTLKSRLVSEAPNQVKQFKAGDRVLLHWSGFDSSADAIRGVVTYDAGRVTKDRFLFPAEIVTPQVQNDYVTFRFRAPDSAFAALKSLKPGEWVTVTSRHRPSADADAVVSVNPYVTASKITNTTN